MAAQLPFFRTFKQGVAGREEGPMQVFTVDGQLDPASIEHPVLWGNIDKSLLLWRT